MNIFFHLNNQHHSLTRTEAQAHGSQALWNVSNMMTLHASLTQQHGGRLHQGHVTANTPYLVTFPQT